MLIGVRCATREPRAADLDGVGRGGARVAVSDGKEAGHADGPAVGEADLRERDRSSAFGDRVEQRTDVALDLVVAVGDRRPPVRVAVLR